MKTTAHSWFHKGCRFVPLHRLTAVEVLPTGHGAAVQVSSTVLFGTPGQLRWLANELIRAADLAASGS